MKTAPVQTASLPMYDRPELAEAHAHFWGLIRDNLIDTGHSPNETLEQKGVGYEFWTDANLLLSQTCGLPFRSKLVGKVNLVGTPDYGLENCPPGTYCSALVVRRSDARNKLQEFMGGTFALNSHDSQSGFAALRNEVSRDQWFSTELVTGAHIASAKAVAKGKADCATLDAVSWRLMQQYDSFAAKLRVLLYTQPTPGLPYITALGNDPEILFDATKSAIETLRQEDRELLGIYGLHKISRETYCAVPTPKECLMAG